MALAKQLNAERRPVRVAMESEHDSRQSSSRHRNPEQRALCRAARVESTSICEGSGHRQTCLAIKPAVRVGDDRRSPSANRRRRVVETR